MYKKIFNNIFDVYQCITKYNNAYQCMYNVVAESQLATLRDVQIAQVYKGLTSRKVKIVIFR